MEETASGWGVSNVKENKLQSSWITFRGGVVSICLCYTALVWTLMVLSEAKTFLG